MSELTSACSTYTFATYMDLLYYKMEQSLHLSLGIHKVAGEEEQKKRAEWSHREVRRSWWRSCFDEISMSTEYSHSFPLL